jgi:helicase
MEISELPIDDAIKEILRKENITTLHPPQEESIKQGVLDGENLVLAIPTASGKTLIAELAILQKILNEGGKAVYLSPLRALASEKFDEFSKYKEEFDLRITLATGDVDKRSSWVGRNDIIIATNEKFDSLLRREAPWLEEVKIVVSDEVHLINDPTRGPTLEVVLAQIRYLLPECQILCLSATISNATEIAQWLDAKLVTSNWRPVKLKEGFYHDGSIVYGDRSTSKVPVKYSDPIIDLAVDTVEQGGQALVFATTRPSAMSSAEAIAKKLSKHLGHSSKAELAELSELILTRGEKTKISERLSTAVKGGVAFHHAGLNPMHRKIVEESFKQNKIKVITSTPTLAWGINLPARRVIIRSLYRYSFDFGRNMPIPVLEYKQQAGRAGRPKYDTEGEALIVVTSEEKGFEMLDNYVLGDLENIWSKLGSEPVLRTQVLALAASGYVESIDDVLDFINRTFYGFQNESWTLESKIREVTSLLLEEGLLNGSSDSFEASTFGERVSELYIDPLSAIKMRSGIKNMQKTGYNVTTFSFLHLICNTPDMRNLFVKRNEGAALFTFVTDIEDQILADLPKTDAEWDFLLMEIKTAKVLNDWINELSEDEMHKRYGVGPGDLLNLTSTGEWLLNALKSFLDLFSKPEESKLVDDLVLRVKTGSKEELLDLVRLKGVGRVRARALYAKGFTSLSTLALVNMQTISKIPGFGKILAKSIIDQARGTEPLSSKGTIDAFSELSSLISKEQTTLDDWLSDSDSKK